MRESARTAHAAIVGARGSHTTLPGERDPRVGGRAARARAPLLALLFVALLAMGALALVRSDDD